MNDTRYNTLTALERAGYATATELAELLGSARPATSMILLRARKDGLVCFRRRTREHHLSDRGRDRLQWLREQSR
jgi:DNA-binding MarR family transcriptional regulator